MSATPTHASLCETCTHLRPIVTRVIDAAEPLAAARGCVLNVDLPAQPIVVEVDPRRIERVLRNLVSNAVEHGAGEPVEVTLRGGTGGVAVTVRDHGAGLRPGEASLVFGRFWRADPARARTSGGTGLGLSIAMEDARLHGGYLQAWGAPGRGSVFRLTLPWQVGGEIGEPPLTLDPELHAGDPQEQSRRPSRRAVDRPRTHEGERHQADGHADEAEGGEGQADRGGEDPPQDQARAMPRRARRVLACPLPRDGNAVRDSRGPASTRRR